MTEHADRFSPPLHAAFPVEERAWRDGVTYRVGDRIAYNVAVHDHRRSRQHTERREGTIAELWVENWWGDPLERLYAEVDQSDGHSSRVHFWRDKVGIPMGVTGVVPDESLF